MPIYKQRHPDPASAHRAIVEAKLSYLTEVAKRAAKRAEKHTPDYELWRAIYSELAHEWRHGRLRIAERTE